MRKLLVVVLLVLTMTNCTNSTKRPAHLSLSVDTFHFGKMHYLDTLRYSLIVKNTGEDLLRIIDTESSCGCLIREESKLELNKEDSALLKILFIPKNSGDKGLVVKFLSFRTNGTPPLSTFTLTGKVEI